MNDITSKAAAQDRETQRLNNDHELSVLLAPAKWEEFKSAFRHHCEQMTTKTSQSFRCLEPDADTFQVCKLIRGTSVRAIDFSFHRSVPAISFMEQLSPHSVSEVITFTLAGQALVFSKNNVGIILQEFVMQRMLPLTGWQSGSPAQI